MAAIDACEQMLWGIIKKKCDDPMTTYPGQLEELLECAKALKGGEFANAANLLDSRIESESARIEARTAVHFDYKQMNALARHIELVAQSLRDVRSFENVLAALEAARRDAEEDKSDIADEPTLTEG